MASKSKVYFFFDGVAAVLADRRALKKGIEEVFQNEKTELRSLNYIFCNDSRLLQINRKYLGHDDLTDIITFPINDTPPIEAEIYISIDRIKVNASKFNQTFRNELLRVMFHGALHLCGYGDKTSKEISRMRKLEDHYLTKFSNR